MHGHGTEALIPSQQHRKRRLHESAQRHFQLLRGIPLQSEHIVHAERHRVRLHGTQTDARAIRECVLSPDEARERRSGARRLPRRADTAEAAPTTWDSPPTAFEVPRRPFRCFPPRRLADTQQHPDFSDLESAPLLPYLTVADNPLIFAHARSMASPFTNSSLYHAPSAQKIHLPRKTARAMERTVTTAASTGRRSTTATPSSSDSGTASFSGTGTGTASASASAASSSLVGVRWRFLRDTDAADVARLADFAASKQQHQQPSRQTQQYSHGQQQVHQSLSGMYASESLRDLQQQAFGGTGIGSGNSDDDDDPSSALASSLYAQQHRARLATIARLSRPQKRPPQPPSPAQVHWVLLGQS